MRIAVVILASAILWADPVARAAEQTVTLTIKLNGEVVPPPASATIVIDGHE